MDLYTVKKKKEYDFNPTKTNPVRALIKQGVQWSVVARSIVHLQLEYEGINWWFKDTEIEPVPLDIVLSKYKKIPIAPTFAISKSGELIKLGEPPIPVKTTISNTYRQGRKVATIVTDTGRKSIKQIAELVLSAYKNEHRKGRYMYHRDGDPMNCHVDNLYYLDKKIKMNL